MNPPHIRVYTSDYGYGHASRDIALIRRMRRNLGAEVSVRTGYPAAFMERSLPGVPISKRENDVGVVMRNGTVSVDAAATEERLRAWIRSWEAYVRAEERFCREKNVDVIVSDIAPQPFLVAESLGIPGVALSNFSWHLIYTHLFGTTPETEVIREAYRRATGALVLPLHEEMEVFRERQETGHLCRERTRNREEMRRQCGLSDDDVVVYCGSGLSLNAPLRSCMEGLKKLGIKCLVSSNLPFKQAVRIPEAETETQDYIAMCDLVVTKPGYSTVSEAMQARVPLLLYRRESFAEDDAIIGPVEENGIGKAVSYRDLDKGAWMDEIDTLLSMKENYNSQDSMFKTNGADDFIRRLL